MIKQTDLVPDIDFAEKGWENLWVVIKPKKGNKVILLYPNNLIQRCLYSTDAYLYDEDTGEEVIIIPIGTRWRYKKLGRKQDYKFNYG